MFAPNGKLPIRSIKASTPIVVRLNRLFESHDQLDSLLQVAAQTLVESLDLQICVITWVTANQVTIRVRAKYRRKATNMSPMEGEEVLVCPSLDAQVESEVAGEDWPYKDENPSAQEVTAPLKINQQIVGYVCATPRDPKHGGAPFDTEQFHAMCEKIGHAIACAQMRQMLASRYVAAAAQKAARSEFGLEHTLEACMLQTVQNPEHVARIIARSFYKDLRRAGFAAKQILLIASEIIGYLNETFHKTKAKTKKANF